MLIYAHKRQGMQEAISQIILHVIVYIYRTFTKLEINSRSKQLGNMQPRFIFIASVYLADRQDPPAVRENYLSPPQALLLDFPTLSHEDRSQSKQKDLTV